MALYQNHRADVAYTTQFDTMQRKSAERCIFAKTERLRCITEDCIMQIGFHAGIYSMLSLTSPLLLLDRRYHRGQNEQ